MYDTGPDPYCYSDSAVLRNKAGLRDADELEQFEAAMSLTRADEPAPDGALDAAHYRAIHHHLFQDVFDWAGEYRTVRLSKGGSTFCYPEYIEREMESLFGELASRDFLRGLDRRKFAKEAAHLIAELNAIHPFREGNGRTQVTFLLLLGEEAGHELDIECLDPSQMSDAAIHSFAGDEKPLADLIESLITAP